MKQIILILLLAINFCKAQDGDYGTHDGSYSTPEECKATFENYSNTTYRVGAPHALEMGKKLYVAQAVINGSVQVGKVRSDWTKASIPYGGREIWVNNFKTCSSGRWKPLSKSNFSNVGILIPSNAVVCGNEANGKKIYAIRFTSKKFGQQVGKYSIGINVASFSYGGKEYVLKPTRNTSLLIENDPVTLEILIQPQCID